MPASPPKPRTIALALLPLGAFILVLASLADLERCQKLFLGSTYYLHLALVLTWLALLVGKARPVSLARVRSLVAEDGPGIVIAATVTLFAALAIEPALRVLSDEANLVGISKNLFASKSPTFTLSGKHYYGNYWDVDVAIDQRPTLFPFFISLVHMLVGYSHENAFHLNLAVLPFFLFSVFRLGKDLGGPTLGIVAALLSVSHPIVLLSVRSGGFDFFAAFFSVLVLRSLLAFLRKRRPVDLALVWIHLCLLANVRYESALFAVPVIGLLAGLRVIRPSLLRPYAALYAASPAFLLPRIWLSLLRGNIPKLDPGQTPLSAQNFLNNSVEYLQPVLDPLGDYPAHSAAIIFLGLVGVGRWLWLRPDRSSSAEKTTPETRFAIFAIAWVTTQVLLVFSYVWGRAQYPSAARLVLSVDVFFSLVAAWFIVRALRAQRPFVAVVVALGISLTQFPTAVRGEWMNKLTETRENAEVWRFFERLDRERILIVSRRPIHFSIMKYGAMTYESAKNDPYLFTALDRHLFQAVYLIQHVQLSTGAPLPGYEFWSDRELVPVFEFQNEANVLVRIARVERAPFTPPSAR